MHKQLIVVIGGVLLLLLVGIGLLAGMEVTAAGAMGLGTPGSECHAPTPVASPSPIPSVSPVASSTPGNDGEQSCFPTSPDAPRVVQVAITMANALYVNPACGKHRGMPDCTDSWYTSAFPQAVISYGQQWCQAHGDCSSWANGNYQCVSFVRGAYSQVDPMPFSNDAFALWATYQHVSGWQEIPAAATADVTARFLPEPGDVMVFKDGGVGHVAIVLSVQPPEAGKNGLITFANANSRSAYDHMPLMPNLLVDTRAWDPSGELVQVWGYIRPNLSAKTSSGSVLSGTARWSDESQGSQGPQFDVTATGATATISKRRGVL